MSFVSASTGWAWGPGGCCAEQGYGLGTLAKTTDGGTNWQTVATPGIDYGQYGEPIDSGATGVRFVDDRHGYLFGDQLFVTSDGGATWRQATDTWPGGRHRGCRRRRICAGPRLPHSGRLQQPPRRRLIAFSNSAATGQRSPRSGRRGRSVTCLNSSPTQAACSCWHRTRRCQDRRRCGPNCLMVHGSRRARRATGQERTSLRWPRGQLPGSRWFAARNRARVTNPKSPTPPPTLAGHWHEVAAPDASGYVADLAAADAHTWVLGEARGGMLVTHDGGRSWQTRHSAAKLPWGRGMGRRHLRVRDAGRCQPMDSQRLRVGHHHDGARTWRAITFPSGR